MNRTYMKQIVAPIDRDLIISELTEDKFLRRTNKAGNDIYIITHHDSPNIMQEIGRLREVTFREAGGGTGKETDIDAYDTAANPYKQLIVWDPDQKEILGGYRYITCDDAPKDENGDIHLATSRLFTFSDQFKKDYLPYVIELGRSFVQPQYQSTKAGSKALFALDNLWDGLGALIVRNPHLKYFFGKVTMYKSYNKDARNIILSFLEQFFADSEKLVYPKDPLFLGADYDKIKDRFVELDYTTAYKKLSSEVRNYSENIPPLVNAYMGLSPTMKTFGTIANNHFGGVEETGILITINDMYNTKVQRHLSSYLEEIGKTHQEIKLKLQ